MHDEWELLVITEGIEPGDLVEVENEDGETETMVFVKTKGKGVFLKGNNGEIARFSSSTLDETSGYRSIVGKFEES